MRKKVLSLLMGCVLSITALSGTVFAETQEDPVSLRIVMYGNAGTRNTEFFKNEWHDKILEDINVDMTVDILPWGSEDQIMTMAASGEGFAFMGGLPNRAQVMLAGLCASFTEEQFEELAPDYIASRMGHGFDCQKFEGLVYGIPCGSTIYGDLNDNIAIRNDILNTVDWDVSQIEDFEDLTEAMAAVHEKYPTMRIAIAVSNMYSGLQAEVAPDGAIFWADPLKICVVDDSQPDSDEVISNLESEYFKNFCHIMEDWMEKGYITIEDMTDPTVGETAWSEGNALMTFKGNAAYLYVHDIDGVEGSDVQYLKIKDAPKVIQKDSNWAWMVSKADQDKTDAWCQFFNWIYASEENYMMTLYGIEGQDWHYDEQNAVEKLVDDEFIPAWMMNTLYYGTISEEKFDAEEIDAYLHFDDDAIYTKSAGFIFDTSVIESEAAKIQTIVDEKLKPLAYGIGNYEEKFPAILEELKAAGLDEYVAEYQRQFTEFMANK